MSGPASKLAPPGNRAANSAATPDRFRGRHYHFIGIGGIGMSSLAQMLIRWGATVSGSDRADSEMLRVLKEQGAVVSVGHAAENVLRSRPDVVVYSKAIPEDNPELAAARSAGMETIHRAELLRWAMDSRTSVCVCGTHGKSTTTAMIAAILMDSGQDPTVMLGGVYPPMGGNARIGRGPAFVAEACEAYGSFLSIYPTIAVVTNIEPDHLDENTTFDDIRASFRTFLSRVPPRGVVIGCADSQEVARLLHSLDVPVQTYALESTAGDWAARRVPDGGWELSHRGDPIAALRLAIPGKHNVSNALAAIAAAHALGVAPGRAAQALASFAGVDRRFSVRGVVQEITVIDDYAHHPTEIQVNLEALRERLGQPARTGRILAGFQPHLFSRTQLFMDDFVQSFEAADMVVITEIYAAREAPIPGVTGAVLAKKIQEAFPSKAVRFEQTLDGLARALASEARPGDAVVTFGAGDITNAAPRVLNLLKERPSDR